MFVISTMNKENHSEIYSIKHSDERKTLDNSTNTGTNISFLFVLKNATAVVIKDKINQKLKTKQSQDFLFLFVLYVRLPLRVGRFDIDRDVISV